MARAVRPVVCRASLVCHDRPHRVPRHGKVRPCELCAPAWTKGWPFALCAAACARGHCASRAPVWARGLSRSHRALGRRCRSCSGGGRSLTVRKCAPAWAESPSVREVPRFGPKAPPSAPDVLRLGLKALPFAWCSRLGQEAVPYVRSRVGPAALPDLLQAKEERTDRSERARRTGPAAWFRVQRMPRSGLT